MIFFTAISIVIIYIIHYIHSGLNEDTMLWKNYKNIPTDMAYYVIDC